MSFDSVHGDLDDEDGMHDSRSPTPLGSPGFGHDDFSEPQPSTPDLAAYNEAEADLRLSEDLDDHNSVHDGHLTAEGCSQGDGVDTTEMSHTLEGESEGERGDVEDSDDPGEGCDVMDDEEEDEQDSHHGRNAGSINDSMEEGEGPEGVARVEVGPDMDDAVTADDDEDDGSAGVRNEIEVTEEDTDEDHAHFSYRSLASYPDGLASGPEDEHEVTEPNERTLQTEKSEEKPPANQVALAERSGKKTLEPMSSDAVVARGRDSEPTEPTPVSLSRPQRHRRRPQRWEGGSPVGASTRGSSGANVAGNMPLAATLTPNVSGKSRGQKSSGAARDAEHLSRPPVPTVSKKASVIKETDVSTVSIRSSKTSSPPPEPVDPFERLSAALSNARKEAEHHASLARRRQAVVEAFHEWQLTTISAEANYQKGLHSYLKRKLRKRAARSQEQERIEEEALRSACSATCPPDTDGGEDHGDQNGVQHGTQQRAKSVAGEGGFHSKKRRRIEDVVPRLVRLPLEAYLPRRVCKAENIMTVDQLINNLPRNPSKYLRGQVGSTRRLKDRDSDRGKHAKRKEKLTLPIWRPQNQ